MDNGTDYIIANLQARATAAEAQNAVRRGNFDSPRA
jgi:hypothetical protein